MFCDRCGVLNRAGRTVCVHCMWPLKPGAEAEGATCAEHPNEPANGRCVTCGKLVCEACGGVVSNRGVYCIDHTPAVTTSASASPGMNPLLAGASGAEPAATAAAAGRARANVDRGMIAAIAGVVLLLVFFGIAFGYPGPLRSGELPAAPVSSAMGGGGYPGGMGGGYPGDPYATGAGGGYPGGPPGGYPGGPPGGPAGYSTGAGTETGGPVGAPPGAPPGGPTATPYGK